MKLKKYTFRTPLFGSIECEELLSDTDGRIELAPQQMCRMYDMGEELLRFLTENAEDLAEHLPEELEDVVLRAEFGDCAMCGGSMLLRTHIWVDGNLTETGIEQIQEWIRGQMSDGWGEGLEQRAWKTDKVKKPIMYFDEYTLEFVEDEIECDVSYYVNPWNADEFYIYLDDCEEVAEVTSINVVATVDIPNHSREVIKFDDSLQLKLFLKECGQPCVTGLIKDNCPVVPSNVYLVRELNKDDGSKLLPKWVVETGVFCGFYDVSVSADDEIRVAGYQMHLSRAILELLK